MKRTSLFRLFVATTLIALVSGCASVSRYSETIKPSASVSGIKVSHLDFDKIDLILEVMVENRNPLAINLAAIQYALKIGENRLVEGNHQQSIAVAARSTTPVSVPMRLSFAELKRVAGDLWDRDFVDYQIDLALTLPLPLMGDYTIPLAKQGTMPVPKVPQVKLQQLQVEKVGLSGAELLAKIEVANPNGFDLTLANFDYTLSVNQQQWGEGNIATPSTIGQKSASIIAIPLKLDLRTIGSSAYRMILNRAAVEYQVNSSVTVDTPVELLRHITLPFNFSGTTSLK
jgi:LEA14-like dessication related protein